MVNAYAITNTAERLDDIIKRPIRTDQDFSILGFPRTEMEREGFPGLNSKQFVDMFCKEMKCHPIDKVNRIVFRRHVA